MVEMADETACLGALEKCNGDHVVDDVVAGDTPEEESTRTIRRGVELPSSIEVTATSIEDERTEDDDGRENVFGVGDTSDYGPSV